MPKEPFRKNRAVPLAVVERELKKNPEFRRAYDAARPKYDLIAAIVAARLKGGLTQQEVARRANTTQSAVARFESGGGNPTIGFLMRLCTAVGCKIVIREKR